MYSGKQALRLKKFKASDIGGLDKELKEIEREKIDKKVFIFNPEENEYSYYGG